MAKITRVEQAVPVIKTKKKVAAYARISMESERMNHSLSAQISYYSSLIQKNPDWQYAGVFADDGISGTGIAKRDEFKRMIKAADNGEIDIILTKSIQRFARNTVDLRRMLSNEKYKGDALLQKEFTVDFLQKKMKKNEGEVPQYYVEGNHEAIISPAVFDMVQAELAKRTKGSSRYSGVSIFSNKIRCGDCGGFYGSKVWHSTDQYRKVIYRCNRKYNGEKCNTPHITEDEVKAAFVSAYNQLVSEKADIIANVEIIRRTLCVTDELQEEKSKLEEEMAVLVEMTQNIMAENARVAQDQDEYQKRYDGLVNRYDTAKARYDEVVAAISEKEAQGERLANFIRVLKKQDGVIREFDSSLWGCMVEYVIVDRDKTIVVIFKDGTKIKV